MEPNQKANSITYVAYSAPCDLLLYLNIKGDSNLFLIYKTMQTTVYYIVFTQ